MPLTHNLGSLVTAQRARLRKQGEADPVQKPAPACRERRTATQKVVPPPAKSFQPAKQRKGEEKRPTRNNNGASTHLSLEDPPSRLVGRIGPLEPGGGACGTGCASGLVAALGQGCYCHSWRITTVCPGPGASTFADARRSGGVRAAASCSLCAWGCFHRGKVCSLTPWCVLSACSSRGDQINAVDLLRHSSLSPQFALVSPFSPPTRLF